MVATLVVGAGCLKLAPGLQAGTAAAAVIRQDVDTGASQGEDAAAEPAGDDLAFLTPILRSASTDPQIRRGAAERLLASGSSEAMAVLAGALRSGDPAIMSAVLAAVDAADRPPPELFAPTVDALGAATDEILEDLTQTLGSYGGTALERVADCALDTEAPFEARRGPIYAMRAFRSRAAAEQLIVLIDPNRGEQPEVTAAACASLERLTGLSRGWDEARWRDWWAEARFQSESRWLATLVKQLGQEIRDLQAEVKQRQDETDAIQDRLLASYRDLFPSLSRDEQLRRLPRLLDDDLAPVRMFAIERVDRMLRDSVRLPEELTTRLTEQLDDAAPQIRLATLRLLDEMLDEGAARAVADRLADETDPQVIGAYLDVLAKRPTPDALDALTVRLGEPPHADQAAAALWTIVPLDAAASPQIDALRQATRAARDRNPSPAILRLWATIADNGDLAELETALDGDDPLLRRAVAEGFAQRGLRQPLIDRAGDEEIYPYAVRSSAHDTNALIAFQQLAALKPPPAHVSLWEDAIRTRAATFAPHDLLAADEVLRTLEYAGAELRWSILERVEDLPVDSLDEAQRLAIVERAASLAMSLDRAPRAFAILSRLNPETLPPLVAQLKFTAAIHVGQFDVAYRTDPSPEAWLGALSQLVEAKSDLASRLCGEIETRFAAQLEGEDRARFDTACAAIIDASTPSTGDETAAASDGAVRGGEGG